MRFLEVASRVVWLAPAFMSAEAVSVRPLLKDRVRGVRRVEAEGWSMEVGKIERR